MDQENRILSQENAKLNKTLTQENECLRKEREQLTQENERWRKECEKLTPENEWWRNECEILTQESEWWRKEHVQMTKENDCLRKEREQLTQENECLRKERVQMTKENDCLRKEREQLTQENESWRKECEQLGYMLLAKELAHEHNIQLLQSSHQVCIIQLAEENISFLCIYTLASLLRSLLQTHQCAIPPTYTVAGTKLLCHHKLIKVWSFGFSAASMQTLQQFESVLVPIEL